MQAIKVFEQKRGDCGGFSLLLVALYRHIGIPSRLTCGVWNGLNSSHCWCELLFPPHGWMAADGSAANAQDEHGEYAYYFGAIDNLNARTAIMPW